MQVQLIPHPTTPVRTIEYVDVEIDRTRDGLHLIYAAGGDFEVLAVPPPAKPDRADKLWRTTCFELFVRDATGPGYREFNLSPSGQWAAYAFESYREGMAQLALDEPPSVGLNYEPGGLMLGTFLTIDVDPGALIGLSAVIEEADGTKSYWALAHPPGKPDFHHPDCFVLELPPAV